MHREHHNVWYAFDAHACRVWMACVWLTAYSAPPLDPDPYSFLNPQGVFVVHNKLKDKSGQLPQELLDRAYFKWVRGVPCGAGASAGGRGQGASGGGRGQVRGEWMRQGACHGGVPGRGSA